MRRGYRVFIFIFVFLFIAVFCLLLSGVLGVGQWGVSVDCERQPPLECLEQDRREPGEMCPNERVPCPMTR